MKEYTMGFVILHFLDKDMTIQCVDCLLETFFNEKIIIVIVDNGSNNSSGKCIEQYYANNGIVNVILNDENLGFANGNNTGYKFIKKNYICDYICVMNNDVLIEQKSFYREVERIHSETSFHVLGPKIIAVKTGLDQNPAHINGFSKEEIINLKRDLEFRKKFLPLLILKNKIIRKSNSSIKTENINYDERIINPVLHGACYIFSHDFINSRDVAFNAATFLYFEEDILHYECQRDKMKMVYDPSLKVKHLEDVSTDAMNMSQIKKFRWKYQNMLDSIEVMLSLIDENRAFDGKE